MAGRNKSVKLGLIGCGQVTEERHLPALKNLRGVEVVALADINPERVKEVANRFHIGNRYSDYRALLDHPAIEAVAICVPTQFHAEIALAALDAGKHLLIEKPLALNLDESDRLIERAAQSSNKIMVGFNMRWHHLVLQAQEIIRRGTLGQLKSIRSVYTHYRSREDAPEWTRRREMGGGVVLNEAVHHFDMWRFLLQNEVEQIFAISQSSAQYDDETTTVTARMTNGVLATGVFSLKTSGNNEIEIYGEAGRLYVSCYRFDGLEFFSNAAYPGDIPDRLRKMTHALKELPHTMLRIRQGGDFVASYQAEWHHFIDSIEQDKPPGCTLEDGRRALQVALAVLASASSGQPVQVAWAPRKITPVLSSSLGWPHA